MNKFWWADFKTADFEGLDPDKVIAVLPVAAIEQHGPHLPVATDFAIQNGMLHTLEPMLAGEAMDVRVLPVQAIGKSNEHVHWPGTLTISAAHLLAAWQDIGDSVARTGIRKLVIVNSHGGNEEIMGILAREMRVRHKMMAIKTSWMRFGAPQDMYDEDELKYGIHGGDRETSLMLHFAPHLVDMDKAADFRSSVVQAEGQFTHLRPTGTHAFAWESQDIHAQAVAGPAHLASAQKGAKTARHQAAGFVELLRDVEKARLSDWIRNR